MHRFLSNIPLTATYILTEEYKVHQLAHVFRSKKGDKVLFFEPNGGDFIYEIVDICKGKITFVQKGKIENILQKKSNTLTVFQAFPNKISTIETIVQKLVEIGIDEIIFFSSQHSQLRDIPSVKKSRITMIAQEALEQCGGNVPMLISYFTEETAEQMLQKYDYMTHIIGFPEGQDTPTIKKNTQYGLWIGPEGGWSTTEKDIFLKNNTFLWSMNGNILRLETASIVGAGILSYLFRI